MARILIAGESWMTTSTHTKGVDEFTVSSYVEGVAQLRAALTGGGHDVTHMPAHLVPAQFPATGEALSAYDVVILSDIGANSLALAPETFERSELAPDRIEELASWVRGGGALLMIGGYLSFSGFQARAAFAGTAIDEILPVAVETGDDRRERPAGVVAELVDPAHPIVTGITGTWPPVLGYNRTALRSEGELVATVDGDPLIATRVVGEGRTAVFTSDCSPHWAPPAFCDEWDGYPVLFNGLVSWLTAR